MTFKMNRAESIISLFHFVLVLFLIVMAEAMGRGGRGFDENYVATWGQVLKLNQGKEVQLSMDQSSGSLISFFQNTTTF